jgi:hypothetical protein
VRRLTHRGVDISTLNRRKDIVYEMCQELVEATVFGVLALSYWVTDDGRGDEISTLISWSAWLVGVLLSGFCLNRLFVVAQLVVRMSETDDD